MRASRRGRGSPRPPRRIRSTATPPGATASIISRWPKAACGGAQGPLAQHAAMGVHQRKGGVVANGADVAEMIGEALELRHQAAQPMRARRAPRSRARPRPRARRRRCRRPSSRRSLARPGWRRARCSRRASGCRRLCGHSPSRSSSRTTASPLAWKRKWPGSMIPAWTGPTGIWCNPAPCAPRKAYGVRRAVMRDAAARADDARAIGRDRARAARLEHRSR